MRTFKIYSLKDFQMHCMKLRSQSALTQCFRECDGWMGCPGNFSGYLW